MRLPSALVPTFSSDRSWTFDVPAEALWGRLTAVGDYARWWPWLAEFDPVGGFRTGASWACTVAPPVPYRIRFALELVEVRPSRSVRARITGDIRGEARLTVVQGGAGSTARLTSSLSPANPVLRGVGMTARPLVEWGHDWVLDTGQRQFVDRAFAAAAELGDPTEPPR